MNRKMFLSSLVAIVAVPAIIMPVQVDAAETETVTSAFSDIGKLDKTSQDKIQTLATEGIIKGFTDGTFRPTDSVTRGQYASFIANALDLPSPQKRSAFKDVTKQVSSYEGIVRAYEAGIIKGYTKERFAPHETITRAQMAIMLDNALQYKASYPTKAILTYTDKGKIGASSLAAVQRLTHYGIMSAYSGKSFSPSVKGDRLMTVLSIHELMDVKGLLKSDVVVKPEQPTPETKPPGTVPYKPDSRDYTLDEMRQLLPATTKIERTNHDGSIKITDMVEQFYNTVQKPGYVGYNNQPQKAFLNELSFLEDTHQIYANAYPKYELISVNGVPYRYTELYPNFLKEPDMTMAKELNELVAKPPRESGKFLIDIGLLNQDMVTYTSGDIKIEHAGIKPRLNASKDFIVDLKAVFNDTDLVQVSLNGLTVSYKEKTLQLEIGSNKAKLNGSQVELSSSVTSQQGIVLAPIQSVASQIGLSTRKLDKYKDYAKVEVANYELPVFTLSENNSIISYEGYGWER